jgi:DNA-binding MarR family transcriptional regulator
MNFEETLPYLFTQISTFYRVEIEKALAEIDLHSGQIFILFELWKTDGLSQIELSTNLKVSPATINKMVKSLEKSGFIVNSRSPLDKRVMRVFLTLRGAAIRPTVEEKWHKLEQRLLGDLTATEQLVLSQLFNKLIGNLLNPIASK